MGLQMSQNFPSDFVMITSERPHYFSLSLSQAKNVKISIRLRYIRSFCSTYDFQSLCFSHFTQILRLLLKQCAKRSLQKISAQRDKRMSPKILVMTVGLLGLTKVQQLFGWDEKASLCTDVPPPSRFFSEGGREEVSTQATKKPP